MLPNEGVRLARLEFIINRQIGIHPKALLDHAAGARKVDEAVAAYPGPREFSVQWIAEGVSTIAAAFHPKPVIVRMSDFKSNEYANLVDGPESEPHEENPMLGYRGASRYLSPEFAECFAMEAEALRYVRDTMGLTNVKVMIPFVRTLTEARGVVELLAERSLEFFDGFSIGSNDMTQLTLGLDRDSGLVAAGFDERDPAVQHMLSLAIAACRKQGKYVGICGQGPFDSPDLAAWLLNQHNDTMSLNPDTVVDTWLALGQQ